VFGWADRAPAHVLHLTHRAGTPTHPVHPPMPAAGMSWLGVMGRTTDWTLCKMSKAARPPFLFTVQWLVRDTVSADSI